MFMSLCKGRFLGDYAKGDDGNFVYRVGGAGTSALESAKGYVHVLRRQDFSEVALPIPDGYQGILRDLVRSPELRAFSPIKPLAIVEVKFADFPHPILPLTGSR